MGSPSTVARELLQERGEASRSYLRKLEMAEANLAAELDAARYKQVSLGRGKTSPELAKRVDYLEDLQRRLAEKIDLVRTAVRAVERPGQYGVAAPEGRALTVADLRYDGPPVIAQRTRFA